MRLCTPQGPNLLKLARKEQCLALLTQLRTKFKLNGQFYRVFPNGEVRCLCMPQAADCGRGPYILRASGLLCV